MLEDHIGDIVRKARGMSGVSATDAAAAAGISESDWLQLESAGETGGNPNWAAVAGLLGLNPAKLEGLAAGWQPARPDLARWPGLLPVTTTESGNTVHAYLVWDAVTREAAVFDTGWNAEPILAAVSGGRLHLKQVFITHSHPDHMAGLAGLRDAFPEIQLHSNSAAAPARHRIKPGDRFAIGSLEVTWRATPGHAEDGVTWIVEGWPEKAPLVAIVGDTIFAGSMGRGNQSWELARRKVREEILTLPPDALICPGHGPLTTVAEELAHNPFF
ncbi:MAG: MBL fold metallo-hydrolase [Verrucomicrobiota bacterium]